jgi:hypothetical protein
MHMNWPQKIVVLLAALLIAALLADPPQRGPRSKAEFEADEINRGYYKNSDGLLFLNRERLVLQIGAIAFVAGGLFVVLRSRSE